MNDFNETNDELAYINNVEPPTVNTTSLNAPKFSVTSIDLDTMDDDGKPLEMFESRGGEHALQEVVKPSVGCISEDENRGRMAAALAFDLPSIAMLHHEYAGRKVIVCGGGSSLTKTITDIKAQLAGENPPLVLAVNKTHDWLINEHGIKPDFGVLMDPRSHIPDYMTPTPGVKYLFAGSVDPRAFDKFKDAEVYLWHPIGTARDEPYLRDVIKTRYPLKTVALIPGPSTVGLRSVYLAMDMLGFATIELHGFDSCYDPETDSLWPYRKGVTFESVRIDFTVFSKGTGSKFKCVSNPDMARQVYEFDKMIELFLGAIKCGARTSLPCITVAGDGAIPWMAWKNTPNGQGHATPERMEAKYGDSKTFDYQTGAEFESPQTFGTSLNVIVPGTFAPAELLIVPVQ